MQHSLVYMILPQLIMIFPRVIFLVIYLDISLSAIFKHKNVTLTVYEETVVKSPGYPNENYEQDTIYTWDVTAPATTEKILINVEIDIHKFNGLCEDYLQIQENNSSLGNFTVFKQCGNDYYTRTATGNRLLITLFSNYDKLTSSGFQIRLKVLKVGTTSTTTTSSTPSTTTMHVTTKATTSESTLTTTVPLIAVPSTTITPAKVQTSSTTTPSTTTSTPTPLTTTPSTTTSTLTTSTTTPSTTTPSTPTPSTTTPSTTTPSTTTSTSTPSTTTSTPKSTTHATSLTTPPKTKTKMTPNTNQRTSPFTSAATTSALITSDGNASTKTISKLWSSSFQSTRTKSFQRTTKTQPNQSSTSETTTIMRLMDIVTDKDTTFFWNKTVILLIGLGVLEVTLIVVGVLAVQRYRRKRKYYPSRKRNGDHTNTLKRQNSCGETHVYDEIDINDVKEEEEESQYKELPDGVYDTALKRRSHLKVVGERKSNYSRGSIINMFRTSSFFRRKVNETSVMTFTSFKGPIQSNIVEKK